MRRSRVRRWCGMAVVYLLVAAAAALGWLWHSLPSEVCLEPGQALTLPRFAWVEPLHPSGTRNAASTRAAGSYRTTLSLGGWLPVKTIRALVTDRPTVTVCGTPFGVKMFSEGALVVGFSDIVTADGTVNPAKQAGLRLGDRVIRLGAAATETNDAVHEALEAAEGQPLELVYVRDNVRQIRRHSFPGGSAAPGRPKARGRRRAPPVPAVCGPHGNASGSPGVLR